MPEGPELHLTSLFINKTCDGQLFSGKVVKNPVHKCPDIDWNVPLYTIKAESRGKEIILHLKQCTENVQEENTFSCSDNNSKRNESSKTKTLLQPPSPSIAELSILFTFGMSGKFDFTPVNECPKHSHLSFITQKEPKMALSFIDQRRFGKWYVNVNNSWSPERGPCVITEFDEFIENLANNLEDTVFKKPICEVMLNQKYFNGIGNYLRAEILFRCKIPPFDKANTVLQLSNSQADQTVVADKSGKKSRKKSAKSADQESVVLHKNECLQSNSSIDRFHPISQELIRLCHTIPLEVVNLGTTKYTLANLYSEDDVKAGSGFTDWLQCYYKPGMKNMSDHNKRTIWFSGPAGPLAPKDQKPRVLIKSEKAKNKKSQSPNKKKESAESKDGNRDTHSKTDDRLADFEKKKRKKSKTNTSSNKTDTSPSITELNSDSLTEEPVIKIRKRVHVNQMNKTKVENDSDLVRRGRSSKRRKD